MYNFVFWVIKLTVSNKIDKWKNNKYNNSARVKGLSFFKSVPKMVFKLDSHFNKCHSHLLRYTLRNKKHLKTALL